MAHLDELSRFARDLAEMEIKDLAIRAPNLTQLDFEFLQQALMEVDPSIRLKRYWPAEFTPIGSGVLFAVTPH